MTNMSGIIPNKEVTPAGKSSFVYYFLLSQPLIVADGSSSALPAELENERQNLSPQMKDFLKTLERNAGYRPDKSYPVRNHTI